MKKAYQKLTALIRVALFIMTDFNKKHILNSLLTPLLLNSLLTPY